MATAVPDQDSTECEYCMEKGALLVDPRILPCTHISCYPCLQEDFVINQMIRCEKCR